MFIRDGIAPSPHMLDVVGTPPHRVLLTEAGPEAWLVTRYSDCKAVLADRRFLGTGAAPVPGAPDLRPLLFRSPGWPGGPSGPELRKLIAPRFTPARIADVPVRGIVSELLDDIASSGGPADLCAAYTFPLPARVICALLGLRTDDLVSLARWSADIVTPPFLIAPEVAEASWEAIFSYFARELGTSDEVRVGLAISLFVAGHETTTSQLGYGIVALLQAPDQADLVRASDEVATTAVEEIMRYFPINADGVPRLASEDVAVGGVVVPAGSTVIVGGPAAAFDPAHFPDPLRFDVTRDGAPHLSFGHGAHFCVGAALARTQLRIALPELLRRFPDLRLEQDKLRIRQNLAGGLEELLVTW
ncbi:cytochrome P450 [Lentzea tibetensis]|uniref:Cytochrome P450 n=1 Tax=Lentzea tibetensis TaxID=2591470 RepID=A0A563EY11_9PSEU|nr:cytochrome P450 [Lentzea tibetensis]TWP52024.1 cytochrome P450 [Lentzea tibetensis]